MRDEPDYYKILEINPEATPEELRAQHRKLVRELHPDRHDSDPHFAERLTQVNAAFHELRDEFRRSAYDRRRREAAAKAKPTSSSTPRSKPTAVKSAPPLRPMNNRYSTRANLYSMHPAARRTRKRNALIGAFVTAFLAFSVVAMFFTVLSPGVQSSLLDLYNAGAAALASHSKAYLAMETNRQYKAIEDHYRTRIDVLQSEAENTIAASQLDAASLQNVGDVSAANNLRRDVASFQSKLAFVGTEIDTLSDERDFAAESKLESSIDVSLSDLDVADRELSLEASDMRRNSTDVDSTPDASQIETGSQSSFSVRSTESSEPPADDSTDSKVSSNSSMVQ